MAAVSKICEAISEATAIPLPRIVFIKRHLIEERLIEPRARGVNAAPATSSDAAKLLIATMASMNEPSSAIEVLPVYDRLHVAASNCEVAWQGLADIISNDHFEKLTKSSCLGEAVTWLINAFIDGTLPGVLSSFEPNGFLELEVTAPNPLARVAIGFHDGLKKQLIVDVLFLPDLTDPACVELVSAARDFRMRSRVSHKTLAAIGAALTT